jgi:DNA-binding transcriptional MerR regulator
MTEGVAADNSGRRTGKSAGAFRTISEVASELDVPSHVLRFWETKFVQVRPLKRGGGRRYYRPEDIALLRRIRSLLYDDGYTIKGVQKLLRDGGLKDGREKGASPEVAVSPAEDVSPAEAVTLEKPGNGALGMEQRAALTEILGELQALREMTRKT